MMRAVSILCRRATTPVAVLASVAAAAALVTALASAGAGATGPALPTEVGPASALPDGPFPDFNGDHLADVAVSVSQEDVGAGVDAGAVQVFYGDALVSPARNQLLSKDAPLVPGDPGNSERFGDWIAEGDFNGDTITDLATGAWGENIGTKTDSGRVYVFYGTIYGLVFRQVVDQNTPGVPDQVESTDEFGHELTADDFNGDGYADLAIGAPRENLTDAADAGVVHVLFGGPDLLRTDNSKLFRQGAGGIPERAEKNDNFGDGVSAGDFDGDGYGDLVVGAPAERIGTTLTSTGVFHVLYGGPGSTLGTRNALFSGNTAGMPGPARADDRLGCVQYAGDFNGDGRDDLAVGSDGRTVDGVTFAGAVVVLYSDANGVSTAGSQLLHQATPDIADDPESFDNFGDSLAAGDFDGNGADDLVISIDKEDLSDVTGTDQGAVEILYGSPTGLSATGSLFLTQQSADVPDDSEDLDIFGSLVRSRDYDGDGYADIYIAAGGESFDGVALAGQLTIMPGGPGGITATPGVVINQDLPDVLDRAEERDRFGDT